VKNDIIIAGVGGQGILTIAATIGIAALHQDLNLKQAEVHGMSQRGGAVQSHLRISDTEIASDLIPLGSANLILSVEPMESLRYLPYLSDQGWLVTNSNPVVNIPDYPDLKKLTEEIKRVANIIVLDAREIAKEAGLARFSNIVMLGAATPFIDIPVESFEFGISSIFSRKGEEIVNLNMKAFEIGRIFALKNRKN
jgi:indolepyruvate ferredoxin oxidoreductase beta subunit